MVFAALFSLLSLACADETNGLAGWKEADILRPEAIRAEFQNSEITGQGESQNLEFVIRSSALSRKGRGDVADWRERFLPFEVIVDTNVNVNGPRAELQGLKVALYGILARTLPSPAIFATSDTHLNVLEFSRHQIGVFNGADRPVINAVSLINAGYTGMINADGWISLLVRFEADLISFSDLRNVYEEDRGNIEAACPTCLLPGGAVRSAFQPLNHMSMGFGVRLFKAVAAEFYGVLRNNWVNQLSEYEEGRGDELTRRSQLFYEYREEGFRAKVDLSSVLAIPAKYGHFEANGSYAKVEAELAYDGGLKERYNYATDNVIYRKVYFDQNGKRWTVGLTWLY